MIAEAEKELGNVEQAIKTLLEAIALDPLSPDSYSHLAKFYLELGRKEEALELAIKSIEIKPNFPDGHFVLGLVYEALGDLERATQHSGDAERLDPATARRLRKEFESKSKGPSPD